MHWLEHFRIKSIPKDKYGSGTSSKCSKTNEYKNIPWTTSWPGGWFRRWFGDGSGAGPGDGFGDGSVPAQEMVSAMARVPAQGMV